MQDTSKFCTKITRDHVIWAYRLFLGREAESEDVIQYQREVATTVGQLRSNFLNSDEYKYGHSNFFSFLEDIAFSAQSRCIFLHIPKVAGTAFSQCLVNNYGLFCLPLIFWTHYTEREYACAFVYEGHFLYPTFCNLDAQLLYLSAVREPVARALSTHNFYRTNSPPNWRHSLFETLEGASASEYLDNPQCCYLSGQPSFDAVLEVWEKENFVVGCFDYLQEFVNTCAYLLHWKNRELPRENVASDPNYKQKYLEEPGLMELLRERNQEDQKLYEYVKSKQVVNTIKPDFDLRPLYPRDCIE